MLAALPVALFAAGEALVLARTDAGRILAAKYLHAGDRNHVTRLIGKHIRRGLEAVGVPRDSVRERIVEGRRPALRWRVGLAPDASLLQANHAITQCLEEQGAVVLSGAEHPGTDGGTSVVLTVGLSGRPTHEVELIRLPQRGESHRDEGRVAVVLYGFGDDPDLARKFFQVELPFAVALPPGAPSSAASFREARAADREVVLHLPLEPIHYPQVNPGPGTVLVTMSPSQITGLVRRYLDQAGPVAAVANLSGSLATQDMTVMSAVYQELRRRRIPFVHMSPVAGAVCKGLAADLGVVYEEPDAVLDREARQATRRALDARWTQILEQARDHGPLLVMVRATPRTLEWLPGALEPRKLHGVSVVPVASLIQRPPL